jgi:integrase
MLRIKLRVGNKVNSKGESLLIFDITNGKKRIWISSSISIPPELWNHTKQEIKKKEGFSTSLLNADLSRKKNEIIYACEEVIKRNEEFTKANILKYTEKVGETLKEGNFDDIFKLFLAEKGKKLAKSTIDKYIYLKNALNVYCETKKYPLSFTSINSSFIEDFEDYFLNDKNVYNNGFGGYVKNIKAFLKWATEKGYNSCLDYKKFKVYKEDKEIFPLEEKEIEIFEKVKLVGRHDEIRDIFLFQIYTGLRISDTQRLRPQHINNGYIKNFHDLKTNNTLIIPLIPKAKSIVEKYKAQNSDWVLPRTSTQDANRILKDIAILVGLIHEVIYYRSKGKETKEFKERRCDIISTHDGRRTFISHCLSKGMSAQMIMKITGHKDYKSFEKYIRFSNTEISNQLNFIWK